MIGIFLPVIDPAVSLSLLLPPVKSFRNWTKGNDRYWMKCWDFKRILILPEVLVFYWREMSYCQNCRLKYDGAVLVHLQVDRSSNDHEFLISWILEHKGQLEVEKIIKYCFLNSSFNKNRLIPNRWLSKEPYSGSATKESFS